MNETIAMILAALAGIGLGMLFFGGLWFTVKKAVRARVPALWIFSSFFLRIGITLLGFYFVGAGNWQRLIICLIGFIIGRLIVVHFTKSIDAKQMQIKKELIHEA